MRLSIAIPEDQLLEAPAVLQLIRKAQASDMEADDEGPIYVAYFEDLLRSIDVVRSIGRSDLVVAIVRRKPALFPRLIDGMHHADELVRMRAADAVEKSQRRIPRGSGPSNRGC